MEYSDIVNEALYKAWLKRKSFQNKSSLYTWIVRIVINECLQSLNNKKKRRAALVNYNQYISEADKGLERKEERINKLMERINVLPQIYKEALLKVYIENISIDDAAFELHCAKMTLYQRLHIAKLKLADAILSEEKIVEK